MSGGSFAGWNAVASLVLVIAPEGTRSATEVWKSGFYYIATAAHVPIIPAAVDAGRREVRLGEPMHLSGDLAADMGLVREFFEGVRGIRPERQGPVRLREEIG